MESAQSKCRVFQINSSHYSCGSPRPTTTRCHLRTSTAVIKHSTLWECCDYGCKVSRTVWLLCLSGWASRWRAPCPLVVLSCIISPSLLLSPCRYLQFLFQNLSFHLLPSFTPNFSLFHSAFRLGLSQFFCLLSVFDHISSFCDSLSLTRPCDLVSKSDLVSNDHLSNQRTMLYEQWIIACKICRSISQSCITPHQFVQTLMEWSKESN